MVDALASGASGLMVVEVQVLFWAPDTKKPPQGGFFVSGARWATSLTQPSAADSGHAMRGLFVVWCLRAIDYEACGFEIPLNPLSVRPHTTELTTQINCVSKTEETREIITKMVNALDDHVIEARNRSSSLFHLPSHRFGRIHINESLHHR